jgi:predicted Rossmann-fold nucleotide-binding protein
VTTEKAARDWAIIGVVGATDGSDNELCKRAKEVGAWITAKECAVLTGGRHTDEGCAVKDCALRGAAERATPERPARLIGILPDSPSRGKSGLVDCDHSPGAPVRYLYAHTSLSSKKRDELTAKAADVLIVLRGGRTGGTALEVAWALDAGRPVVFLDSWNDEFRRMVASAKLGDRRLRPEYIPSDPPQAKDAQEAVELALKEVKTHGRRGEVPVDNPVDEEVKPNPSFKRQYDECLSQLRL